MFNSARPFRPFVSTVRRG
jgi:hypothetical protein